ncbi:MAG TPA: CCA tRNA nucleotidyltransferase [Longimicrobiaceae bacterium]|nr:CCA tRNA nucleotidyltransferase [Longimicrobiaceae bacterium]
MTPDAGSRPDLHPPGDVVRIARRLEDAGFSTWAVGGAVRDGLAGRRQTGDWDLATAARPGDVRRLFRRTVPVGIEHGTVGVVGGDGRMYEVTTFRRDVETDGRHAKVSFSDTVEEDLTRRDFTINAVAWHPLTREVRDPHGGRDDLRRGVLRTVGDPAERFREDRLRVLRGLRFAGRFGLAVDGATWEAARAVAPHLPLLSPERVREELLKLLREVGRPSDSLRLYQECGALAALYPELERCVGAPDGTGGDVWSHLLGTVDRVPRHRVLLRLGALVHDAGKPLVGQGEGGAFPRHAAAGAAAARELLRRIRCSNAETDTVTHLVAQHADLPAADAPLPEWRRWLRRVGPEHARDLLRLRIASCRARAAASPGPVPFDRARLAAARRVMSERAAGSIGDLAIGGAELRGLGLPPGPLYGEVLKWLLEQVTDDPGLNERETLLRMVRERIG